MTSKQTPEYQRFTGALKKVLQVSHEEMKAQLQQEKAAKVNASKPHDPKRKP